MSVDQIVTRADTAYEAIVSKDAEMTETASRQRAIARDELPWVLTDYERWDAVQALETMAAQQDGGQ